MHLPSQQLDATHGAMNKYRSPGDANFELVSSTIKEMVGQAKKITLAQREGKISPREAKAYIDSAFSTNGYVYLSCQHS